MIYYQDLGCDNLRQFGSNIDEGAIDNLGVASMIYNKFVRAGMALIKLDNNKVC
jgi:hypothetical protein